MTDTIPPNAEPLSKSDKDQLSERSSESVYLKREPLPSDTVALLRHHAERTGVGAMRLLRGAKDKPSGLSATIIVQWIRGSAQNAVPFHVAYVLDRWAALPTNKRIPLTPDMRSQLNSEFLRTGSGPVLILKKGTDIPSGLTRQIIQTWASEGPKPNTTSETHWNYVMGRLRSMPDRVTGSTRFVETVRQHKAEITAAEFAELHHHRKRTGIGGAILLRDARDKPEGLTPAMIAAWLSRQATRAAPGLVTYVLARYRGWP